MQPELTDKNVRAIVTDTRGNQYYATVLPVYCVGSRVEFYGYPAGGDLRETRRFVVTYRVVEEVRP